MMVHVPNILVGWLWYNVKAMMINVASLVANEVSYLMHYVLCVDVYYFYVLISSFVDKLFFIPNKCQLLILVFCYLYLHTTYQTLKHTKITNISADDASTPNPLEEAPFNEEEALLDAGEEAAATAMEA
jgi:hypothetical protein